MSKLRINKTDAAARQINAAIRMTFHEEDPVAIHSVIAAGHAIVRDLCERRGDIESYLRFTDWIAPGREKEFWRHWNACANFLKHADTDADSILELDDEQADFLIVVTSKWFFDLGNSPSEEMRVFLGWWVIRYPNSIKADVLAAAGVMQQLDAAVAEAKNLSRLDTLRAFRKALPQIGLKFGNGWKE